MSEDNTTAYARRIVETGGAAPEVVAEMQVLLASIKAAEDEAAAGNYAERRKAINDESAAVAGRIQAAYKRLLEIMPANPLGNMTIG